MFKVVAPEYILMDRLCWGLRCFGLRVDDNDPPWRKIVINVAMVTLTGSFLAFQLIAAAMCPSISCVISNFGDNLLFVLNLYNYIAFLLVYRKADHLLSQLKIIMVEFGTEVETVKVDKLVNAFVRFYEIYLFSVTVAYNVYPIMDYQDCLERNNSAAYIHSCGKPG